MGKHVKTIAIVIIICIAAILAVDKVWVSNSPTAKLSYTDLYAQVDGGNVKDVTISGQHDVTGDLRRPLASGQDSRFTATIVDDSALLSDMRKHGVAISVDNPQTTPILQMVGQLLPFGIMVLLLLFILRQAQSGGSQALSFGRSRAKLMSENRPKVTFNDVAGIEEAKEELGEVVEFLKFPKKFQALGARIPKGVLLLGPPGSGKTLLARAIAGEAGVPFFSISGSDFVEMFVGVGASRVRDLFEQAKKSAPCIVFIVSGVRAWAVATTSASKRSTNCSSRWTASIRIRASS